MHQFQTAFNPLLYGSNNIPRSTDHLFSYSGYTAGLMTGTPPPTAGPSAPMQHTPKYPLWQQILTIPSTDPIGTYTSSSTDYGGRYSGMYASTGFDMLSIMSRLVNRPNPHINLGPVDFSCAFVVVDARQYDLPIAYVSPQFERLTGYSAREVIGRNCRFLQAPDGRVAIGSRRRYTDNSTAYHIKTHIIQGKESQCSIINYRKSGQPFVNLLTVIPISLESDEIDYFVGLLVDLVDQPNAIIQNMKDGTYMVNYRSMMIPPSMPSLSYANGDKEVVPTQQWTRAPSPGPPSPAAETEEPEDIEAIIREASRDNAKYKRIWEEMLLKECPDFVHVVTMKGIFLYCSDSVKHILGYEPGELEGKSINTICHPSDLTTILRELKQSNNETGEHVNFIYRAKTKKSGYIWIECCGKLRNEDGRGRKYIVLSGRERPVYGLSKAAIALGQQLRRRRRSSSNCESDISAAVDHEFWCKLNTDGLILYASWSCANILGYAPSDVVGLSLYQLMKSNQATDLTRALAEAKEGKVVCLEHALIISAGIEIKVTSTFYPDGSMSTVREQPTYILMQIRIADEDIQSSDKDPILASIELDVKKKGKALVDMNGKQLSESDMDEESLKNHTCKLPNANEKIMSELNLSHEANWQYEIHQLRITNKKLRDELQSALNNNKKLTKGTDPLCADCLRRLQGYGELVTSDSQVETVYCNTCILRRQQAAST